MADDRTPEQEAADSMRVVEAQPWRRRYCRCHWCCQSTPPDKRGEGHKNCAP